LEPQIVGQFRLGDIRHFRPDVSKLASLGWRARDTLDVTVQRFIEWFAGQGAVPDRFAEAEQSMQRLGVVRSVRAERRAA
jgi:hypothetical protein